MCGIVAFFSKSAQSSPEHLERATSVLHHRGPDGKRTWMSPDRRVGLGHVRLSIIDLVSGDQPLENEDGSVHAVVNGEFYDFQLRRRELEDKGHKFKTNSDSEILLHLYEEYGANCIHHLRGEFAFVLWDAKNQLLFAGRDRFGIKPLYYSDLGQTLWLASEAKSLFAAGLQPRWDRRSFFQAAAHGVPLPDKSFYEDICQIPPGHYLIAGPSQRRMICYWDFDYLATSDVEKEPVDAVERFRHVLESSVRLRLHADVPVACYLSGGLDSASVLGIAARHSSTKLRAFTLSFDDGNYDETEIAREMAANAGADFHPIEMTQDNLADHFSDSLWHCEVPCINMHGTAKYLLSRAVREAGFKVAVTGEGADEILAGYPHFRRDHILCRPGQTAMEAQRLLKELQGSNTVSSGVLLPHGQSQFAEGITRVLGYFPSWIESFSTMAVKVKSLFSDDFAMEFAEVDPYRAIVDSLNVRTQLLGRDPVHQSMYLWSKTALPNYILTVLGDRMEMAHSIEGRVPFLDHHVVECARSLPVSSKIRNLTEKYVLREAAKPFITKTIYQRQKHPFLSPAALLNPESRLHQLLQDTLRGPALAKVPFYNSKKVIDLLDKAPELDLPTKSALDAVLSSILSVCLLQDRFGL